MTGIRGGFEAYHDVWTPRMYPGTVHERHPPGVVRPGHHAYVIRYLIDIETVKRWPVIGALRVMEVLTRVPLGGPGRADSRNSGFEADSPT